MDKMTEGQVNPAPAGYLGRHFEQKSTKFWVVALLASFIVPPVGLLLAAYLIFKLKSNQKIRQLLIALAAVALSIVGGLIYLDVYSLVSREKRDYSQLEQYTLLGKPSEKKAGMSFLKPKEFSLQPQNLTGSQTASAHFRDYKTNTRTPLGTILSSSTVYTTSGSVETESSYKVYLAGVRRILNRPTGETYADYQAKYISYLQSITSKDYDIKLGKPTPLRTPNINKDAWKFDFTAISRKNAGGYKPGQEIYRGYLVLAFGEQTYCYFAVFTAAYLWQPNAETWQRILDSLKIDQ